MSHQDTCVGQQDLWSTSPVVGRHRRQAFCSTTPEDEDAAMLKVLPVNIAAVGGKEGSGTTTWFWYKCALQWMILQLSEKIVWLIYYTSIPPFPEHSRWYIVHSQQQVQAVSCGLHWHSVPSVTIALNDGLEQSLAPELISNTLKISIAVLW